MGEIFSICRSVMRQNTSDRIVAQMPAAGAGEAIPIQLESETTKGEVPPYLPDLARLELAVHRVQKTQPDEDANPADFTLNPTLEVVPLQWHLPAVVQKFLEGKDWEAPARGEEWALIYRKPGDSELQLRPASQDGLLAIKLVAEDIDPRDAAGDENNPYSLHACMMRAAGKGLLIAPPSRIRRPSEMLPDDTPDRFAAADGFTIQWHITNRCDLHCKHCYDRTRRSPLTLPQGERILDEMGEFCIDRNVRGHVCFSGGNPFLSPHFFDHYRGAVERGFGTSILGNPVTRGKLDKLVEIARPGYYQVSLEGLEEHNDSIRGEGTYRRAVEFLDLLEEMGISSSVMLTLTGENIEEVLRLGEMLRERTEYFTFNRLSPVGEGADLLLPDQDRFEEFLRDYVAAAEDNPILGFKDNLINIVLREEGREPFGGCTGYGCGAAFNFVAILPDGEVHACRKFPSPIGNVLEQSLAVIHDSDRAARYRRGTEACEGCELRATCGGCLASASGHGLDIFRDRDPYCFCEMQDSAGS
jgi:selenobiotic family peptide radical SAM maturase